MKHKLVTYIVGLGAAVALFLLGWSTASAPVAAPSTRITASHTVDFLINDGTTIVGFENVPLQQNATVLTVLQEVAMQKHLTLDVDTSSSMGAFVKQIGQQKNGVGGKYWQYWVGGVQPQVAADRYQLRGGETILWTFSKSQL